MWKVINLHFLHFAVKTDGANLTTQKLKALSSVHAMVVGFGRSPKTWLGLSIGLSSFKPNYSEDFQRSADTMNESSETYKRQGKFGPALVTAYTILEMLVVYYQKHLHGFPKQQ